MERSYLLKRRIVEETYSLPGEAPDVEDLNDEQLASDDEDDDDLEPVDHALGDATDDDEFDDE